MANAAPGLPLADADLARSFLLSWFDGEPAQVAAHAELWVPLELAVARAGGGGGGAAALSRALEGFCAAARAASSLVAAGGMGPPPLAVGGAVHLGALGAGMFPVYRAVRELVETSVAAAGLPATLAGGAPPSPDVQRVVAGTMRRMVEHVRGVGGLPAVAS